MTVESFPKQKPSWPMLMLGAGLIALVIGLAALYNLTNLGEEAQIQSYLQRLNAFPKDPQQTQVILAAPGNVANLEIQAQKSIKGLWSSDALTITVLETETGKGMSDAIVSKDKVWNLKIQHNAIFQRRDAIFIKAAFTLSPDAPIGKELLGSLQGNLVYPVINAEGKQEDAIGSLNVPFTVKVVPPAEIAQKVQTQAKTTLGITLPIALVLIAFPLAYLRKNRKTQVAQKNSRNQSRK